LEKLVKVTAAEGLVAGPLTVIALSVYVAYFFFGPAAQIGTVQVLLLVGFVLLSSVVLLLVSQGFWLMVQQRRTQGVKWWGGDLDSGLDEALRMSFHMFSVLAGCWLLWMSLTLEAYGPYIRAYVPALSLRYLGRE
jgi:hypothetical protein